VYYPKQNKSIKPVLNIIILTSQFNVLPYFLYLSYQSLTIKVQEIPIKHIDPKNDLAFHRIFGECLNYPGFSFPLQICATPTITNSNLFWKCKCAGQACSAAVCFSMPTKPVLCETTEQIIR